MQIAAGQAIMEKVESERSDPVTAGHRSLTERAMSLYRDGQEAQKKKEAAEAARSAIRTRQLFAATVHKVLGYDAGYPEESAEERLPGAIVATSEGLSFRADGMTFHRSSYAPHHHLEIDQACPTCQEPVRVVIGSLDALGERLTIPNRVLCTECYAQSQAAEREQWIAATPTEPTPDQALLKALSAWLDWRAGE